MTIQNKLTLQFALIAASILLTAALFIYILSAGFRQEEFYDRLSQKARSTARLLIEVNEVDHDLLKIIDRNTISLPSEQTIIYNYLNEEIYNSNETVDMLFDETLLDEIRIRQEVRFHRGTKEFLGLLYTDQYNRFVVIASAVDVYGLRKLDYLKLVLLAVFGGSMVLVIGGGWVFARQALKPMAQVIDQVDQISANNLHARVAEGNGQDEIAKLSQTFNKMLGRVESAFLTQKSFVSNASHELRTPLTAITGQIEVSLLKKRNVEEYQQVLQSVLEDIRQLTHLTNGLLELAQLNPQENHLSFSSIRLDELLLQARFELLQRKPHYKISIEYLHFPEEEEGLFIQGNEPLLKSAFINILDNACKFSGGKPVEATLFFEPKEAALTIIDHGIGIQEEDMERILQPLYRASNAITFQGYGLGLSLAHKIMELHRVSMKMQSQFGSGTQVILKFPVKILPLMPV